MATANLSNDIVDLLGEAVAEIAKLDSPANVVCHRLRILQQRLKPPSMTIGELAKQIDVSPRDVLDAALTIGVNLYWHDGQRFQTAAELTTYLSSALHINPVPELEFDLTSNQLERLAAQLGVEVEQLTTETTGSAGDRMSNEPILGKSSRKFIASEPTPPGAVADKRQHQTSYLKKAFGMTSPNQSSNIQQLLVDAAAEIAALDGTENEIFRRLMAELHSQSLTIGATEPNSVAPSDPIAKPPRKFAPSDSVAPVRSNSEKKQTG